MLDCTGTTPIFPLNIRALTFRERGLRGSVFSLLQAILGLQPDAPHEMLYVDPDLPSWLADVILRVLRVGEQTFDIRFWRIGEKTEFSVLSVQAKLI